MIGSVLTHSATARPPLLVIVGPTAVGKTALAVELARHLPMEVVSADSRQVYRGMDIGTAKASAWEQQQVRHHLIDLVDIDEDFSVADYLERARPAIAAIHRRGQLPVVVGGTGLYIQALTQGLVDLPGAVPALRAAWREQELTEPGSLHRQLTEVDPALAKRLHIHDVTRIIRGLEIHAQTGRPLSAFQQDHGFRQQPYRVLKLALQADRQQLYDRIDRRVEVMLEQGLIEETRALLQRGYSPQLKALRTIGYRQSIAFLLEGLGLAEARSWIQRDTRRYAKQQLTWLRRDHEIKWVEYPQQSATILAWIDTILCKCT